MNDNLSQLLTPPWLLIAKLELGVSEIPGRENNQRILQYQQSTSLHASDDETPWCSAFINFCMKAANIPGTMNAAAKSWLTWGKGMIVPAYGCITVIKRGKESWMGHVGILIESDEKTIKLLGGNQGDKVSIATFDKSTVMAYRWY